MFRLKCTVAAVVAAFSVMSTAQAGVASQPELWHGAASMFAAEAATDDGFILIKEGSTTKDLTKDTVITKTEVVEDQYGPVCVANQGSTLNLNGHNLTVSNMSFNGHETAVLVSNGGTIKNENDQGGNLTISHIVAVAEADQDKVKDLKGLAIHVGSVSANEITIARVHANNGKAAYGLYAESTAVPISLDFFNGEESVEENYVNSLKASNVTITDVRAVGEDGSAYGAALNEFKGAIKGDFTVDGVKAADWADGISMSSADLAADKIVVKNVGEGSTAVAYGLEGCQSVSDYKSVLKVKTIEISNVNAVESTGASINEEDVVDVGSLTIHGVHGTEVAIGLWAERSSNIYAAAQHDFKNISIDDVTANGQSFGLLQNGTLTLKDQESVYINVNPDNLKEYKPGHLTLAQAPREEEGEEPKLLPERIAVYSKSGRIDWTKPTGKYEIYGDLVADGLNEFADDDANKFDPHYYGSMNIAGDVHIYGDVFAFNGAEVDLKLVKEGSTLKGQLDDRHDMGSNLWSTTHDSYFSFAAESLTSGGKIDLKVGKDTKWIAMGKSILTDLANDGTIDMSQSEGGTILAKSMNGSGTVKMKLDKDPAKGNMLFVTDLQQGSALEFNFVVDQTVASTLDDLVGVRFATVTKADGVKAPHSGVAMTDKGFLNVSLLIGEEKYEKGDKQNQGYNGATEETGYKPGDDNVDALFGDKNNAYNWYIEGVQKGSHKDVSKSGQTVVALMRGNYWTGVEMDRLNKRLGDARYVEGDDGVWLRMRYDTHASDTGYGDFESDSIMYQLGFDHAFQRKDGRWLLGAAVDYMDADVDFNGVAGEGSRDRLGLKLYGTWLGDNGTYLDVNAMWGRLSQDFNVYVSGGTNVTADFDNHVVGLTLEGGRRFDLQDGYFIEPQAQVQFARISDADYVTSQHSEIKQDAVNSLLSRIGARAGRDFSFGTGYLKADWIHEWKGDETFKVVDFSTGDEGFESVLENKGSWFDAGFGLQANMSKDSYGFVDVEYRFGNNLTKSWAVNAGLRYAF